MDAPDYASVLRALRDDAPTVVLEAVTAVAKSLGATDVVAYLADFGREMLLPVPDSSAHVELPAPEPVAGSAAGQAFVERRLVVATLPEGSRVWVPLVEGSECTGTLALTVGGDLDSATASRCEELGMLAGCAIALAARSTDLYNLVRRRKAMSLAASMQWDLLPPLRLEVPEVVSSGTLEPAYDVGGDCFDHTVNGVDLDVVVMDAMGHGLASSLLSALALGAYRHDRREGQSLEVIHERLDSVVASHLRGQAFVTGNVARLGLRTGELRFVNAGHPPPLLVRRAKVVGELACRPSLPWGLGGGLVAVAEEVLRPDDAVLLYTDGVIEGRSPAGEPFGLDRLIALVERAAGAAQPSSLLTHLVHEVLAHQDHKLRDDATLVWISWRGPSP